LASGQGVGDPPAGLADPRMEIEIEVTALKRTPA